MNSRIAILCAFVFSVVFSGISDGSDSETTTLSLVFRSQSGREVVQFIESEAGVTWVAIGNKGRVCDSGTTNIRIDNLVKDLRDFRQKVKEQWPKLESVELQVIGENVEKSSLDRDSLLHLFSTPQMRQVAESLSRSTKKADRIRFIPDAVLGLSVTTTQDTPPAQNQLPMNRPLR